MVWKEKGASVSPSRQLDRPVGSKVIPPTIITWRGKAGTREGRGKLFGPVFRGGGENCWHTASCLPSVCVRFRLFENELIYCAPVKVLFFFQRAGGQDGVERKGGREMSVSGSMQQKVKTRPSCPKTNEEAGVFRCENDEIGPTTQLITQTGT